LVQNHDLALLLGQLGDRSGEGGMATVVRQLKEGYGLDVVGHDLLAPSATVRLAPEVHRGATDGGDNEGVGVAGKMALVFPVANEGFLKDVIRIGIRPGPVTRDQPQPGAILGQPSLPVTGSGGRGIGH